MNLGIKRILFVLLAVMLLCSACSKKAEKEAAVDPAAKEQLTLGDKYYNEKKFDEAIEAYLKCLEIDDKTVDAYIRLSEIYMSQELPDDAVEILEQGYDATQDENIKKLFGERCQELAKEYYEDEEYDGAIELYQKLVSLEPSNVDAYLLLNEMYIALEEYDSADEILERGYEATKDEKLLKTRYERLFSMAESCLEAENYDEAVFWLEKIVELGKENDSTLISLSKAYAMVEEYDKAMEVFEKVVNKDEERAKDVHACILTGRGEQYYNEGKKDEAVKDLTDAIAIDPTQMEAYITLIEIYSESQNTAEADKWVSQSMSQFMNPESVSKESFESYIYTVSDYYSSKDDMDSCLSFWQKVSSLQPDNAEFKAQVESYRSSMADESYSKAEECLGNGDIGGASAHFKQALTLAPSTYKPGLIYADNGVYYLEQNGSFKTGWYTAENGDKYYFSTELGPAYASAYMEWHTIDGSEYYFNDDGRLLVNDETPDGYFVGADGKKTGGTGETEAEETDEPDEPETEEAETDNEKTETKKPESSSSGKKDTHSSGKLSLNVNTLKEAKEKNGSYALKKEQLFDGASGDTITMNDVYDCMSRYGMKVQWIREEATYALAMGDLVIWVFPGSSLSDDSVIVRDTEKYKESLRQKPLPDGTTFAVKFDPKATGTNEEVDLNKIEAVNNR